MRLVFIWGSAFTVLLGFCLEMYYREQLGNLPGLVDTRGNTASLEVAMGGLDAYVRAKQIRIYGFMSLGVGALLCAGAVATKYPDGKIRAG